MALFEFEIKSIKHFKASIFSLYSLEENFCLHYTHLQKTSSCFDQHFCIHIVCNLIKNCILDVVTSWRFVWLLRDIPAEEVGSLSGVVGRNINIDVSWRATILGDNIFAKANLARHSIVKLSGPNRSPGWSHPVDDRNGLIINFASFKNCLVKTTLMSAVSFLLCWGPRRGIYINLD